MMHTTTLGRWARQAARLGAVVLLFTTAFAQPGGSRAAGAVLHVSSGTPGDGATGVPASGFVSLTFDRPMVTLGDVGVAGARPPAVIVPMASGKGRWINTSVWTYQLANGLALATSYRLTTVPTVKALDGSVLASPYALRFETLRPGVQSTAPAAGTPYALPSDRVQVLFNQPVRRASAQAGFSLRANGAPIRGYFTWNGPLLATQPNSSNAQVPSKGGPPVRPSAPARETVMTFHPGTPLPLGARITVSEAPGLRGLGGPLASTAAYSWQYRVAGPLAVSGAIPASGATGIDPSNGIKLQLTAPVDSNRVQKAIHVSPKPDYIGAYVDDTGTAVTVNGDFLPSTTYTITVAQGAIGTARQSLAAPYRLNFTTKAAAPSVSLVTQGPTVVYDAYLPAIIYARAVNSPNFTLNLYRLRAAQFQHLLASPPANWDGSAPAGAPQLASWQVASQAPINRSLLVGQPLKVGGAPLPPGYYLVSAWTGPGGGTPADHLLVLITRTAVTLKIGQSQAFVWVTDLRSGKPVAGQSVHIVDSKGRVWASGTTNGDGVFQQQVKGLRANDSLLQHQLMAQLTHGTDTAACSLDWNSGVGPWDFQLPFNSYLQPIRMYLTTERPLYKPGQSVYFKGLARGDNDGRYTVPAAGTPVMISVQDGRGATILRATARLDRFGAFSGKLVLGSGAALGTYTLAAGMGASTANGNFQVTAYKKPDYAVSVISDRGDHANYTQGERVGVQVRARYYFGAPLAKAPVAWDLIQNDFTFQSARYPDYTFGDQDYAAPPAQQANGAMVTQGTGTTNSQGGFRFTVPGTIAANAPSQQFTLEAVLTGPDNQQVAQNTQVVVHKAAVYVGLKPSDFLPAAGKPTAMHLVTVADDGTRMAPGTPVTLRLYRRVWLSSFVRDSTGFFYWQDKHKDTVVGTQSTHTDGQGLATLLLTPKDGGEYLVTATAVDAAGHASVSKLPLWVWSGGEAYVPWQPQNNDRIRLVADKQGYKVGDVAHILVTAPLAGMTAMVTVERGSVLSHRLLTLPSNSARFDLPITGLDAPNVFVGVTLVKGGPGADTALPVWKMGYLSLPVDVSARSLHVSVHASTVTAAPGQKVTFTLHAADARGHGVQAQLAVSLVDKALLALAANGNPSVMDTFYQQRNLGVESAGSATLSIDRLNLNQKVGSKGGSGGGGGGQGPTRVNFPDTAYWNPSVVTNARGDATVTVTLPDNLTTWTLTAIGGTASTLVGDTSMDLVSSKQILLEPALPSFLTAGDSALGGAVVDNLTTVARTVNVTLLSGGSGPAARYERAVRVAAGGSQVVQWTLPAPSVGTRTFLFTAQATDDARLGDRLMVSVPVQANSVAQVSATSGTFRTSVTQSVDVPSAAQPGEGELRITVFPSLVSGLNRGTTYLNQYPYLSTEQLVSRFYSLVEALRLPRSVSGLSPSDAIGAPLVASAALQHLYSAQNSDGGWGWWQEDQSDPFLSAYVLDGMLTLKGLGYAVDARVLKQAVNFARQWALHPEALSASGFAYIPNSTYSYDLQSYVTYLLGRAGSPDTGLAADLYSHRQNILPFARAYLALAIAQQAGTADQRVRNLLADIGGAAQQFGAQAHWSDRASDYRMMESATAATAAILDALVRLDPGNPLIPGAARWLMAGQQEQGWDTTQSTVLATRALVDYALRTQDFTGTSSYSIQVNGKTVGSGTITDATRGTVRSVSLPLAALGGSTAKVTLQQRGGGQLGYSISLRTYQALTAAPPVEHGILVSRRYEAVGGSHGQAGSDVRVVLTVTAPEDLVYLRIEDPLPAGAQPVNPSLRTTSILSGLTSRTGIPNDTTDLSWYVSHVEQQADRVALFADYLPAGTYQYSYQLHLVSAGRYHDLPTQASMAYFPDIYGQASGKVYTISAR